MQVILGPYLYEVVTTVFQRSMKSAQAYFRASESRQVNKPSSWQPVSLFCRVDLFFGHFPFKEVLCGPIVYMSPQSGLMASVSVLSISIFITTGVALLG